MKLGLNIDHVATLRQARGARYPNVVRAALICEEAGADAITLHLREDRRHIQDRDVRLLREVVQTKLILEMAGTPEMVKIALDLKPDAVTLVPEKRKELTTEGGLDLITHCKDVEKTVETLQKNNIPVSIFIDPEPDQIEIARQIHASMVEIHTGKFCDAVTSEEKKQSFSKIISAVKFAHNLELSVNAGHGLCTKTIQAFKGLKEIEEFSIGHSIISRAALVGLKRAVKEMLALVKSL